jgi:uncharacterized damage-inducible protein DinB
MSVFTNPAGTGADQAGSYVQAVLDLLGSRDPIDVLHATSEEARRVVEGLSDAETARPEADGKWSIRQVLRHLADSEIVWAWRLRMVLGQDRPALVGYDQDAWAERLGYADANPEDALAELAVLRRGNLWLLERASEDDLRRVGMHAERGEESVGHMVALYAGHDLVHLRQLRRIRARVAPDASGR